METYPYLEQQPPKAPAGSQLAPLKAAPHRPSVREAVPEAVDVPTAVLVETADAQPLWQPLDTRQCISVMPQYLSIEKVSFCRNVLSNSTKLV